MISSENCYQYLFSKIVYELIYHFYRIKFGTFTATLPKEVFELPEAFGCSIIKAAIDDEGHVRDKRITIAMRNEKLVKQIRKLLVNIFGEDSVNTLKCANGKFWTVTINAVGAKRFEKRINLVHPRKRHDLKDAISKRRRTGQHNLPWDTKIKILELLKSEPLTTKQISQRVSITTGNAIAHLNELRYKGLSERTKERYTFLWKINKEGLGFLKVWKIDKEPMKIKLPDWKAILNLTESDVLILLSRDGRERLFWMLNRTLKNQDTIGTQFNVHRNSVCNWKRGTSSMRLSTLNKMLLFLGENGVDLTSEMTSNIEEVRYLNGVCINNRR